MPRFAYAALAVTAVFLALAAPSHAERNLKRPPGTTRYAPMVAQLRALLDYDKTQGSGRMQLSSLGRSVKGRDIWMVTLHDSTTVTPTEPDDDVQDEQTGVDGQGNTVPTDVSPVQADASPVQGAAPKKVLYLCRQHGHEPASTEGAMAFIRDLVKADPDTPLADDLRHVTVYVVPMANPDGAEAFLRHNAHNVDLNRDWLRRTQPETQAWYRAVMRIKPDLMTDQHELYPDDPRQDFTETASVGCGATSHVIATCTTAAATVQESMGAAGFPIVCHWITDHHPARLAHRYASIVAGVPTVLFETNRLNRSGRDVAARGQAHYQFMVAVLGDVAGERQPLLASRHKAYQRPAPVSPAAPNSGGAGTSVNVDGSPAPTPDSAEKDGE